MQMRLLGAVFLVAVLMVPAQATPIQNQSAAAFGGDRLLELQFDTGAFPWRVDNNTTIQAVQGITGMGLLEAFKVTGDLRYLGDDDHGAEGLRNWLRAYLNANPGAPLSASNTFFLARYAVLTGTPQDMDFARKSLQGAVLQYDTGPGLVEGVIQLRKDQGHTNLGLWDAAMFIRAAHDVGYFTLAGDMAYTMATQTIVDPWDNGTNWYEMGLIGLIIGLAEYGSPSYPGLVTGAASRLRSTICGDGSLPVTWQGITACRSLQTTAYGAMALVIAGDVVFAQPACDFLVGAQDLFTGGWEQNGLEIAQVNAEAIMALAYCTLPVENGVTTWSDAVLGNL